MSRGHVRESKISPGSNLMWESSRWMLPEHRQALRTFRREQERQERPHFDEQWMEELNRKLHWALHAKQPVKIELFGEWGNRKVTGIIDALDPQLGRLKLVDNGEVEWLPVADVVEIDVDGEAHYGRKW